MMTRIVIFLIFFFMVLSCDSICKHPGTINLVALSEKGLAQEYMGLQISPYERKDELTVFSLPNGEEFLFNNKLGKIESRIYQGGEQKVRSGKYDTLQRYMMDKIGKLDGLNISAFISDSSKNLFYTRFYDSTFNELVRANPKYKDIQYDDKSDKQYRYVLLNILGSEEESSKTIKKFKDLHSIRRIKQDWYYYRSQFYSSSCKE